ncbi:hypothetical protein JGI9_01260, partial [Candidatus Kryptonium thompsonii]
GTFGASGGKFSVPVNLVEGDNIIQVKATIGNKSGYSNKVNIYRIVEHNHLQKLNFLSAVRI